MPANIKRPPVGGLYSPLPYIGEIHRPGMHKARDIIRLQMHPHALLTNECSAMVATFFGTYNVLS